MLWFVMNFIKFDMVLKIEICWNILNRTMLKISTQVENVLKLPWYDCLCIIAVIKIKAVIILLFAEFLPVIA